jgi:hypothetical protein
VQLANSAKPKQEKRSKRAEEEKKNRVTTSGRGKQDKGKRIF